MITAIIRKGNNNSDLIAKRAYILYLQDNFSQAILHLQKVLREDPDNKECGQLLKKIKKLDRLKSEGNDAFKSCDVFYIILV